MSLVWAVEPVPALARAGFVARAPANDDSGKEAMKLVDALDDRSNLENPDLR